MPDDVSLINFSPSSLRADDEANEPLDREWEEEPDDWELLEPDDDDLADDPSTDETFDDENEPDDDWRDEPYVEPDEWNSACAQ